MKYILSLIMLVSLQYTGLSQETLDISSLSLETDADYRNAEDAVLKSIQWLDSTPLGEEENTRSILNGFVVQWASGTPDVTLTLAEGMTSVDCAECLLAFMRGWVQYSLTHDYSEDIVESAVAGTQNAISFYEKNKTELGKDKHMEKMKQLQENNELTKYMTQIVSEIE